MIRSLLPISLFALLMVFGSGCCGYRYGMCGGGCGAAIDPMLGDCGSCGGCGECGGYRPWGYGRPMRWCGSGCGERYYGEWLSDGPDCCDGCDDCGGWVGGGGCYRPHPLLNGVKSLFGYRYGYGCYGDMDWGCSGCSSCGGGPGCSSCGMGGLSPIEADEVVENIETMGTTSSMRSASPRSSGPHPARRPQAAPPEARAHRSNGTYMRPTTHQRMPNDYRSR